MIYNIISKFHIFKCNKYKDILENSQYLIAKKKNNGDLLARLSKGMSNK